MTDIFVPTMMHEGVTREDWSWFRTFVRMKPGIAIEPVRERLRVVFQAVQEEACEKSTSIASQGDFK